MIICQYCNETQDINLHIIIDYVKINRNEDETVAGRVKMRCRECGREIVNHYFEE